MKPTRALALVVAIAGLALLAFGLTRDPRIVPTVLAGRPAPPFALRTLDGTALQLSDLRGRVVLVNFWASWCEVCVGEHALLVDADRRWHEQGLRVVGIVYDDSAESAGAWMRAHGGGWPVLLDPGSRTAIDYGLFGVPETFVIDRDGRIAYKQTGLITAPLLETWIPPLLGRSTSVPTVPDSALDARTREVAATLRCPACEDVSIADSPADLARDMRRIVREQLAAGATPADVRQYFVDRYGEWILLSPRPTTRTALLWLAPLLAIGVAATGLVVAVRRWTRVADGTISADTESMSERRSALLASIDELSRDRGDGKVTDEAFALLSHRDQAELAAIDATLTKHRPSR